MKIGIIYKVTNLTNQKIYIGSTENDLRYRKSRHLTESRTRPKFPFHKALAKYGEDSFKWEEVCSVLGPELDNLHIIENYFIDYYKSLATKWGYNLVYADNTAQFSQYKSDSSKKIWKEKGEFIRKRQKECPVSKESRDIAAAKLKEYYKTTKGQKQASDHAYNLWDKGNMSGVGEAIKTSWEDPEIRSARLAGMNKAAKERQTPIVAVSIDSGEVEFFEGFQVAFRAGYKRLDGIYKSIRNQETTSERHIWFYKTTDDPEYYIAEALKKLPDGFNYHLSKPILRIAPDGSEKLFENIYEAAKEGFKVKDISMQIRSRKLHVKGYKWRISAAI